MPDTRKKNAQTGAGAQSKKRRSNPPACRPDDGAERESGESGRGLDRAGIIEAVQEMIAPLMSRMNLDLVEVQYRRESGRMTLRLLVDHYPDAQALPALNSPTEDGAEPGGPGGVTLDELTRLSRETSLLLDMADLLPDRYTLEVSSPGLDRLLNYPDDFRRYQNRLISIRFRDETAAKRSLKGLLQGLTPGGEIMFQPDGAEPGEGPLIIAVEQLVSARLTPQINWR